MVTAASSQLLQAAESTEYKRERRSCVVFERLPQDLRLYSGCCLAAGSRRRFPMAISWCIHVLIISSSTSMAADLNEVLALAHGLCDHLTDISGLA